MKKVSASAPANNPRGCRELAVEILLKVETRKAYADILLDHVIERTALPARDRALLTQLVYGTLRWRGRLDWHLNRSLSRSLAGTKPYLRNLLRLTLYQLLFLDRVPDYAAVNEAVDLAKKRGGEKAGGLVNAVARAVLRERERREPDVESGRVSRLAVFCSHPKWLVKKWLDYFGAHETEALLKANNQEPFLTLRANRLRGERAALLELLRAKGFDAEAAPCAPQGIRLKQGSAPDRLPGFEQGLFQVQGEASQLIAHILDPRPGERILDGCAAPGGKTTHIAELMEDRGEIIATDLSAQGLEKLKQNVRGLGIKSVKPFLVDLQRGLTGALAAPYDRILIDAPCSGLGTLRAHPEAKWHREERDIQRLSRLQKKILGRAGGYLKAGGVLVYSTCTLTREENEEVVEDFLDREKNWVLESVEGYLPREARHLIRGKYFLAPPHRHDTDGFFAARMRKAR
ncbi:MAG: 16S rRNA (cytosine(967)-C(5))-methyltransferase RsmB [Deltaproteobacteria bacterium]|nr:16S rRNA (cytosine(967)-C(5))-methyltransferase RsmB [Deltaproteobacteria bacterium]